MVIPRFGLFRAWVFVALFYSLTIHGSSAQTIEWFNQLPPDAVLLSSSTDDLGNVYSAGMTGNYSIISPVDALVTKHDSSGNLVWSRVFSSGFRDDEARGISTDQLGSVFVTGLTRGSLGSPNAGAEDAFVRKYDAAGNVLWTNQFGTSVEDVAAGVTTDGLGNAYVSGSTLGSLGGPSAGLRDGFLKKYDSSGIVQWTKQFGTSGHDDATAVTFDGIGNVYVAGYTRGSLGGPLSGQEDAFLAKYDASGLLQWTKQIGTPQYDTASGVSTDGAGNVYLLGNTKGSLSSPSDVDGDLFSSKFDSTGVIAWTRQLGTNATDYGAGISTDVAGNIYIVGETQGSFFSPNPTGSSDGFIAKIDSSGNPVWGFHMGTPFEFDMASGVSADGLGNVYFSGQFTEAPDETIFYPFVGKIRDVPEPATLGMFAFLTCAMLLRTPCALVRTCFSIVSY